MVKNEGEAETAQSARQLKQNIALPA